MRIIVYEGKHNREYWDASTPEKYVAALRRLFELMEEYEYYSASPPESGAEKDFYDKAKQGDAKALRKFLGMRRDYEYESWREIEVQDPL